MTRFARAEGSKANNSRVPEEATSWSEMKQQLLSSQDEVNHSTQQLPPLNMKAFKTKQTLSKGEWAEFDSPASDKKEKKNKKEKLQQSTESKSEEQMHSVKDGKIKKKEKKSKKNKMLVTSADTESKEVVLPISNIQQKLQELSETKIQIPPKIKKVKKTAKITGEKFEEKFEKKIKEKQRRKPLETKLVVDGHEIEIELFDNFPVMKEDAIRLRELKQRMMKGGIPKDQVMKAMKLERRKAEKALSREKKKCCFHCRGSGHLMSECPKLEEGTCSICFKCGSTEHKSFECQVSQGSDYRYGTCFVCGEQGHIARQCPDNPRGLYPQGGSCRICGDVTHLKKDCPQLAEDRKDTAITLSTNKSSLEGLDDDNSIKVQPFNTVKKNKIIKF